MSTNTCGIRHKSSSTTIECSFAECQISSVSVHGTNSVVQNDALLLLHSALASNRLDICRLLTISRYMTFSLSSCVWPLLFELAPFPGLPIYRSLDRLLTFHGSEKEATTQSSVLYNTAEVVCLGRHLARAHHADGQLPLQQFRCRLKLIPKPKGTYNGTEKLRYVLTLGWSLYQKLYGNQLIRKCAVRFELCTLQQSDLTQASGPSVVQSKQKLKCAITVTASTYALQWHLNLETD